MFASVLGEVSLQMTIIVYMSCVFIEQKFSCCNVLLAF